MPSTIAYLDNQLSGRTAQRVAGGTIALDGSNPTPISTGLGEIIGASASLVGSTAPGVGTSIITCVPSVNGILNLYAWKVTGTGDATLIASTGTETVAWTAIGT